MIQRGQSWTEGRGKIFHEDLADGRKKNKWMNTYLKTIHSLFAYISMVLPFLYFYSIIILFDFLIFQRFNFNVLKNEMIRSPEVLWKQISG